MRTKYMTRALRLGAALLVIAAGTAAQASTVLYAVGQAFASGHGHDVGNFLWSIDITNGEATQIGPVSTGISGLGMAPDGTLYGRSGLDLYTVDRSNATLDLIGSAPSGSATSLEIMPDGRGFVLPFNADFETNQLHTLDLTTGAQVPVGSATSILDAIDLAFPNRDMTYGPFVISLGNVGDYLYGMDLETNTLIEIDPDTGDAEAKGDFDAARMETADGYWSGFAGLTGADRDGDGINDTLYGIANYYYDYTTSTSSARGAIGVYDLETSAWTLVGENEDVIFYSLASGDATAPIPEPATMALLGLGGALLAIRERRRSSVA